jgi:predicted nucleotidyltransferase
VYLKTFQKNANLEDYRVYITCPDNSYIIKKIAKYFNAFYVPIEPTNNYHLTSTVDVKDVTYSLPRFINANYFLISDIDILVMGDLKEAFQEEIGICRDFNTEKCTLGQLLESEWSAYNGNSKALELLEITSEEYISKDIINCGFITGTKQSLTKLDHELRKMLPKSQFYLFENNGSFCREQAVINVALIRANNFKILNDTYNYQLLHADYKENKICSDSDADVEKKVDFIHENLLGKTEMKNLLMRIMHELGMQWYQLTINERIIVDSAEKYLKKELKKRIGKSKHNKD